MEGKPELSIIIVSYNVCQFLLNCIQSILDTAGSIDYEIIVIDNASTDGSAEAVRETFPNVQVMANEANLGYARANNQGYLISKSNFLLLLNPDTVVKPGAIKSVLEFMKDTPDAGIAACRLLNRDSSLQKSIKPFPSIKEHLLKALFIDKLLYRQYWKETYYKPEPLEIDYCSGAFMMVRRMALGAMSLMNPQLFMYAEEKDLALRLREKGWKTYFVPVGEVVHFREQSTRQMVQDMFLELQKSQLRFFEAHYRGMYKILMIWTYWASLCSTTLVSFFVPFTKHNRLRLRLFWTATIKYSSMVKHIDAPRS